MPKYIGPFQVVEKVCENTYLVEDVPALRRRQTWRRFKAHVAQMKPFITPTETDWCPEEWSEDSEVETDEPDEPAEPPDQAQVEDDVPILDAPVPTARITSSGRTTRMPSHLHQFVLD